jgi:DNA-binding MarR family transcriptional regulator
MSDDELTQRVGQQLRDVQRLASGHLMREMAAEMQDLDLSFSSMGALIHLRQEGQLSVSGLAERLRLSLPATSQVVDRTHKRGLIRRTEDPSDRRTRWLTLTPQGHALLDRMEQASILAYAALLSDMDRRDLETLDTALGHLLDRDPPACPTSPPARPSKENA